MKRVFLFLLTNLAVMLVLGVVTSALGVNRYLTANGLNLPMLLAFSAVVGFTGAIFSLLISKPMAKWSTGARVLDNPQNETERWLVETVRRLANKANIGMPEVAVYEGDANAFATGAFKNSSLVAVSTGLLESMTKEEVEAVLAHEIAHVVNGDMVTLTLIQGVVNTFVVFLSRIVGHIVDRVLLKNERGHGMGYMLSSLVAQVLLGILASMIVAWFSRRREFRADAGGARYAGSENMVAALEALKRGVAPLPDGMAAFGIGGGGMMALFSTHPPLEVRIAALRSNRG